MTKTAGRRRADSPRPPEYDLPTREPRIESPRTARLLMFGVLVAWIVGTARRRHVRRGGRHPLRRRATRSRPAADRVQRRAHPPGRRPHAHLGEPRTPCSAIAAVATEANVLLAAAAAVTAVLAVGVGRGHHPARRHGPAGGARVRARDRRRPERHRGGRRVERAGRATSGSTSSSSPSRSASRSPWSGTSAPACTGSAARTSPSWPASRRCSCWCSPTPASCARTARR